MIDAVGRDIPDFLLKDGTLRLARACGMYEGDLVS